MSNIPDTLPDLFARILMLKKSETFSAVNVEDLRIVAKELMQEEFYPGERVFDINDPGEHMFIISSGRIGISIDEDPTSKNYIVEMGPGECFGEMGMLDNLPRSATAHVLESSQLLVLEKSRLKGLVIEYPELALGMLRGLSLRLRKANSQLKEH
jgi:CRP-like cAMP-binding protein